MLSALLISLREGVEAALVVGIVLVYLDRTGRAALKRYVWAGVIAAVLASGGVAYLLDRWQITEDGFEGVLLLVAAAFVVTMIVWMNRAARKLRKEIEQRVDKLAGGSDASSAWGLFLFIFLMVVREGAELALILRAVRLSAEGLNVWIGTVAGLAIAIGVGIFFFKGTLKIPLGRFFAATSIILMIVAFQLALTGVHELSEAQWIGSSRTEMATIGPIVRNDVFFFVVVLGAAAILVLRELVSATPKAAPPAANDAEKRWMEWERRKQRRWMFGAASLCLAVILAFTADFVYARVAAAAPEATEVQAQNGEVRIPISQVDDNKLHFFSVPINGTAVRFIVIKKPGGEWGTALDACRICGWAGYRQDGQNVMCRNCASAIYIPTIGQVGGCNPVGFNSRVDGATLVVQINQIQEATTEVGH
ncbi:MAG TPA: Fe-S-containing protein [Candidatus Acidoferrales bacterium]|nr:Fe-S-containing protein [Candidatus Acidoferrales bacterium]